MDTETRYQIAKAHLVSPYHNPMQTPYSDDDEKHIYITFRVSELKITELRSAVKRYPFCKLVVKSKERPLFGLCEQYNVELIIKK